ncbi:hypothetical protein ABZ348_29285 [Streptomyces sp. NPDC005963]|uniref:hypothetical protein n=1 Tax=Streptomyces sp. NPDC005963 TaxID=3156721 RepID=UPI0033DC7C8D
MSLVTLAACGSGGSDGSTDSSSAAAAVEPSTPTTSYEATPEATESSSASEPSETETATETPPPDDSESSSASDSTDGDGSVDTDGTDGTDGSANTTTSDVPRGQWTGTARITVDFADPGCASASRTYELPATLLISEPVGGESNGFHLSWASDSQSAEGAFGVTSALDGTDTVDGRPVAIGYWSLDDDGGGDISGRLTESGASQGAAHNLVFVPKPIFPCSNYMPFAYALSTDTTLEGTVSESSASLVLSGTTLEGTRSFRVEWS